jgi:hypothetical protein
MVMKGGDNMNHDTSVCIHFTGSKDNCRSFVMNSSELVDFKRFLENGGQDIFTHYIQRSEREISINKANIAHVEYVSFDS